MSIRQALVTTLGLATVLGASGADAREPKCGAAPAAERLATRDATLGAAEAATHVSDRPRGRALFLALLAHDPDDDDAAIGLAKLDVLDGCYALAEHGYRDVIRRVPNHVAAHAGLADVLAATGRTSEALLVVSEGSSKMPAAPELLWRRARLLYLQGHAHRAVRDLDEAIRIAPSDQDLRDARAKIVLGQARIGQRLQLFPRGFDDVATTSVSLMQRWWRLRFEAEMLVVARSGGERPTRTGPRNTNVIDGRPSVGAYAHLANGSWVGGSYGFATPALSMPIHAFAVAGMTPLTDRLSGSATVALWLYDDARDVFIASPALTVAVTDRLDLTGRYWSTTVMVRNSDAETVHSLGLRAGLRVDGRWTLGLDYTYGVQLERLPGVVELLDLRSHVVTGLARAQLTRTFGVDAAVGLERRESARSGAVVFGPSVEAGAYARW